MGFVQVIEVQARDGSALADHLAAWDAEQRGVAPGYEGYRLIGDRDRVGRFTILVEFSSAAEADTNNGRPETVAWGARLAELSNASPSFANFDLLAERVS